MLWALQERPSEQRAERGAYGEQQSWNGGWDTLPIRSFYWQKRWQMQSARNKLLLELTGHAPVMSRHKAWEEGSYSGTAQPPSEKLHILPAWHCRGITLQESSAPSRNLRKKWHSARKKRNEGSVGGIPSPGRAQGVFLWMDFHGKPRSFPGFTLFLKIPVTRKGITLHFMAAGAEQETAWICQDNQEKNPAYFWAALQKEGKNWTRYQGKRWTMKVKTFLVLHINISNWKSKHWKKIKFPLE